ncbi:hypothetical protein C8Q74DRAFT_195440 [Fomes fomentarius]|nr:hypothetical protein C8Q74DRAFT_195440 [Fomes fomentarius]
MVAMTRSNMSLRLVKIGSSFRFHFLPHSSTSLLHLPHFCSAHVYSFPAHLPWPGPLLLNSPSSYFHAAACLSYRSHTSLSARPRYATDDPRSVHRAPLISRHSSSSSSRRPPPPSLPLPSLHPSFPLPMYYPQRPVNAYYPRPVSPVMSMSPVYTPGSYAGSYYDHSPEMRIVPLYTQYAQPLPQPTMIYRQPPVLYNRLVYRQNQSCCSTPCCDDICCDRCCDECCGPHCCC